MAKSKRDNKNNVQKADTDKPAADFGKGQVKLPADVINKILQGDFVTPQVQLLSDRFKELFVSTKPLHFELPISVEDIVGSINISPTAVIEPYLSRTARVQELEDAISGLKKENRKLLQEIADRSETVTRKTKKVRDLEKNILEFNKKVRLRHLVNRVNGSAKRKLLESEEFANLFERTEPCSALIMAVDIRRSTELMLKARQPQLYADFIISLCTELTKIITDNYGVFDKFTGDGILAFFPDFYSGDDSPYWVMKAAHECHNCFSRHYKAKRNCFNSILLEVGLGIGIDYGDTHLVKLQDGLTVIGSPVVYACRLSAANAGQTLLNQPAYEVISQKLGEYVNFQESEIPLKNEGRTLAYVATLREKAYEPKLPDWEEPKTPSKP